MFPEDRDKFHSLKIPVKPQYAFVASIDSHLLLRRNLSMLIEDADTQRPELKEVMAKAGGGLLDLPDHAILDRGHVVGLWEYDVDSQSIASSAFGVSDNALNSAVESTVRYVHKQLDDARSFSLDSPKSRAPRIQILRKSAGK